MVYKQQNVFLIVLQAERLKIKVAVELMPGEGLFPVHSDSSHCGKSEFSGVSFIRALSHS